MICPICDKSIETLTLFEQHLSKHKSQSVFDRPREIIHTSQDPSSKTTFDASAFFGKDKFEANILPKIENIEHAEELVHRRNFVEQVKKIVSKYPFVYLPYFVDDVVHGINGTIMLTKYHLSNHLDLKNIISTILAFGNYRYVQSKYDDAFNMNMNLPTWKVKYQILQDNCRFFKDELTDLTFRNILRSFILIFMTDYVDSGISKQEIIKMSILLKQNYDLFKFIDRELVIHFELQYRDNFETDVLEILDELIAEGLLRRKVGNTTIFMGKTSIDLLKQAIIKELRFHSGSRSESLLYIVIAHIHPTLKLIPELGMWDTALHELAQEGIVHVNEKRRFGNKLILLNDNYQKIQQQIQIFGESKIEFLGRAISPDDFIDELKELEKGDFGDKDDQVTRIAGLVLAESVKIQAPIEDIPEFDFSIDITDYHFRDEQLAAMKKIDFKITSNIFHCKVMLNEVFTIKKYEQIKSLLPKSDQAVVFTLKPIPSHIRKKLDKDNSIQIIDEAGIKIWVSITAKIPARIGSVSKLYHDPISELDKKLVMVNAVNYEDGLASVTLLPENWECTVLVRSLEEVSSANLNPKYFETFTSKYLEFLDIIFEMSTLNNITSGIFDTRILERPKIIDEKLEYSFENHQSKINLLNTGTNLLQCNCIRWEEDQFNLCPHLIASLDDVVKTLLLTDIEHVSYDKISTLYESIIKRRVSQIFDRLDITHNDSSEHYLKMRDFVSYVYSIK